jgi:hypothetical protein
MTVLELIDQLRLELRLSGQKDMEIFFVREDTSFTPISMYSVENENTQLHKSCKTCRCKESHIMYVDLGRVYLKNKAR